MSSSVPFTLEGNLSQLNDLVVGPLGASAIAELDLLLTPILMERVTLEPGNNQHPIVQQLFNWLVDPENTYVVGPQLFNWLVNPENNVKQFTYAVGRQLFNWLVNPENTIEQFTYVVGPLETRIDEIMEQNFETFICELLPLYNKCSLYLTKVALEALAHKNPILKGAWKPAIFSVIEIARQYNFTGSVSKNLIEWVVRMGSDTQRCQNAFLRIEFLNILPLLIDVQGDSGDVYRPVVLDALMSGLSQNNLPIFDNNEDICLYIDCISQVLASFARDWDIKTELKILTLHRCTVLHDVTHKSRLRPIRYTEPIEVQILISLFNNVAKHARIGLQQFKMTRQYPESLIVLSKVVHRTITSFPLTCQMQRLLPVATLSIMALLESVGKVIDAGVCDPRKRLEQALEDVYFAAFDELFVR